MSTLRVSYLKHQSSSNNTVTFDANNLVTVAGNVSITSPLGSNGHLTVANNITVSGLATVTGNITSSGTINDSIGGVRSIPVNDQTSAYGLVSSDVGKVISITTTGVFVPNAVFSKGDNITVYNNSSSSITVTQNTSVTMYLVGSATTGNRTLAQRGLATIFCVAANTFVISGGGLT